MLLPSSEGWPKAGVGSYSHHTAREGLGGRLPVWEGGHPGRHAGWKPALLKEERAALHSSVICSNDTICITPPGTCDAYCVVSLPGPVRRPPPRAARPPASWESGHLGRLRAGSPHSWPLVADRHGAGERGVAEYCNLHHTSWTGAAYFLKRAYLKRPLGVIPGVTRNPAPPASTRGPGRCSHHRPGLPLTRE